MPCLLSLTSLFVSKSASRWAPTTSTTGPTSSWDPRTLPQVLEQEIWFAHQKKKETAYLDAEQSQRLPARGPMARNPTQHSHPTPRPSGHLPNLTSKSFSSSSPASIRFLLKLPLAALSSPPPGHQSGPSSMSPGAPAWGSLPVSPLETIAQRVARGAVAGVRPAFPVVVGEARGPPSCGCHGSASLRLTGLRRHRLAGLQVVVDDLAGGKRGRGARHQ